MDPLLRATLLKVLLPAAVVFFILAISRKRGFSWGDDLGFRPAAPGAVAGWLVAWAAWVAFGEVLIGVFGLEQARPWPAYPAGIVALRILAIGLLGPLAEETLMRGILFFRLRNTRLGVRGAILVTAVGWAALHVQYGVSTLILIAADGLLLGLARHKSGSLWLPIAMHAGGNLFSIAQSLGLAGHS